MTRNSLVLIAGLGSAALLAGAYGFQHIGGLEPCQMCLWQRWPHSGAVLAMVLALVFGGRFFVVLGALAAAATSAIGFFHAGVEAKLWEGPSTCSGGRPAGLSTDELLDQILNAPLVRCDEVPWEMLGVSMAGWNGIISALLVVVWIMALRQKA